MDYKEQLMLVETGEGTFGGYKQNVLSISLSETQIEFYVCTKCKGIMRNACQLGKEQILVCETCVGDEKDYRPMMKAIERIPELKVNCPLATRGCAWNATLSEVEAHLDECQEFNVKCKLECGVILKRRERNNHCSNECLNKIVSCEHCQVNKVHRDLKQHYKVCLEFPLLCPNNCGANLTRKQTDPHIETDCPNTTVKCRYERFGCREVVRRCEMDKHNKTNEIKHLEMSTFFAVDEVDRLQNTNLRLTGQVEQHEKTNSSLTEKLEQQEKTNSSLTEKLEQQEKTNSSLTEKIQQQERRISALGVTLLPDISISYPVVLRKIFKARDLDAIEGTDRRKVLWGFLSSNGKFEFDWNLHKFELRLKCLERRVISIDVSYKRKMSLLEKKYFYGRFKLTIINRANTNDSHVHETPFVTLRPQVSQEEYSEVERRVYFHNIELTTIPTKLRAASQSIELILQIQGRNMY